MHKIAKHFNHRHSNLLPYPFFKLWVWNCTCNITDFAKKFAKLLRAFHNIFRLIDIH